MNFVKLLDKSTPLLANAIANNEVMEMVFSFYRTSQNGSQEKYFSVTLRGHPLSALTAIIRTLRIIMTHSRKKPSV